MRNGVGTYIFIIVLVLLLFGLISIGDVLSVISYIIIGIVVLVLLAILAFRIYVFRLRRRMEQNGQAGGAYNFRWGGGASSPKQEKEDGEITVQQTETSHAKIVRNEVGNYVEYEEIREEYIPEDK